MGMSHLGIAQAATHEAHPSAPISETLQKCAFLLQLTISLHRAEEHGHQSMHAHMWLDCRCVTCAGAAMPDKDALCGASHGHMQGVCRDADQHECRDL